MNGKTTDYTAFRSSADTSIVGESSHKAVGAWRALVITHILGLSVGEG
jgi:hypothetical protein